MSRFFILLSLFLSVAVFSTEFDVFQSEGILERDALDCGEVCDDEYATCKTLCSATDYQCPIACYSKYTTCLASCAR